MPEVRWSARRITDGVLVDVTADVDGLPQGAPTANPIEAGSGQSVIQSYTVTLTNDDIKTLPSEPRTEIVPAPGVGYGVDIIRIQMVAFIADGNEYTNLHADSYIDVRVGSTDWAYVNNSGRYFGDDPLHDFFEASSLSSNTIFFGPNFDVGNPDIGPQPVGEYAGANLDNQAITMRLNNSSNGDLTGGNAANYMRVTTIYSLVDLSA